MPKLDFARISRWLTGVAVDHGYRIGCLVYKFCDDEEILRLNREYLDHDYYTDIMTFDYTEGKRVGADVVISLDTVASNATLLGISYDDELRRVIVHGLLHLFGIKDKTPEERVVMEDAENAALKRYNEL